MPASARAFARRSESSQTAGEGTSKLQKRLADAGLGSRRAMEELIEAGKVSVNGKVARLGARVGAADRITVDGEPIGGAGQLRRQIQAPRVVLYHKPEGEIVSKHDPEGRPSVFDRVPPAKRGRWLAVGRLDFNTCGLLVFTDSGGLANRLTHPSFEVPRDYAVRVVGELAPEQMQRLRTGVQLEDGPARFEILESQGGEGTNRWYRVRVREGRNRLVRRMFAAVGLTVSRLMRTSFGPFELPPRLKRGQWIRLEPAAVKQALSRLQGGESRPLAREPKKPAANAFSGRREQRGAGPGAAAERHRPRRWSRSR